VKSRDIHVNKCLDKCQSDKKRGGFTSDQDIVFLDVKDTDFVSPLKVAKKPKAQGKLKIDSSGNFVVSKPENNITVLETYKKAAHEDGNLDSEISASRLNIGSIEARIAELQRQREDERKNLSRLLKRKTVAIAQSTELVGRERRPLENVLNIVFPNMSYIRSAKDSMLQIGTNSSKIELNKVCPLWELSKLSSSMFNTTPFLGVSNQIEDGI